MNKQPLPRFALFIPVELFSPGNTARCLTLFCFFLLVSPGTLWAKITYLPKIIGCPDSASKNLLISVSRSFSLQKRPPLTIGMLQKRADKDIPEMLQALKSLGYYQARITTDIQKGKQVSLLFHVFPGKQFRIGVVSLRYVPAPATRPRIILPFEPKDPAIADTILNAEKDILYQIGQQGYPFPVITDRQIQVRHGSREMHIQYTIQTGPYARFGTTILSGLKKIDPDYIHFLLPWQAGDEFNVALLNKARNILIRTGLFSTVTCKPLPVGYTDEVQIKITPQERKEKTIKAGIGYSKDKRLLGSINWENRNLLGRGEKFKISLEGNRKEQKFQTQFRKPWLWQEDQAGILSGQYEKQDTNAYFSRNFQSVGEIERQLRSQLWAGLGLAYRLSEVVEDGTKQTYGLFSVPLTGRWENVDDILNPTRGMFFRFGFAPYYDTLGSDTCFTRFSSMLSVHFPLWENHLVFSARSRYGMINGASLGAVPADIRFYAGGGRSVRGYSYQKAGKIKKNGNPLGGRSVLEFSGELRCRFWENYGLSLFLDGGRAFADQVPSMKKHLFWGAGIGFIYHTPIGPLHFDIATPLNKREKIDSSVQIYIGQGVAF